MFCTVMVLVLNISPVSLSNIPGISGGETMSLNNPDLISQMADLIGMQESTIVVFDDIHEYSATALSSVTGANQRVLLYEYHAFCTFLGPHMKRVLGITPLDRFRSQLNFLIICELQCIQSVMSIVTELDNTIGLRSLLRHFSTWLIISHDQPPHLNTNLDNVACVILNLKKMPCLQWRPYAQRQIENGTVSYLGAGIDVINNLGNKFNFSYTVAEPLDMLWGQRLENGSYTGVMGMISRGEADACPVPYLMSLDRKLAMEFSITVGNSQHFALYRRHTDDIYSWVYLISCLPWQVYLCGSASLVWIMLLFACANRQRKRGRVFSAYFEIVTRIPFRQDIRNIPEHISSKVILLTWCIFCMVMTTAYTCNLVAFAAVDKHKLPFNTLRELAEQDEYAIGIYEGGYAEDILKNTNDSVNRMLYRKSNVMLTTKGDNHSTEERLNDTLRRMYDEKFVILATQSTKASIRSQTCEIVTMEDVFFPALSGYVFPRHSPLKKLFNKQLSLLLEMGLLDRFLQKWTPAPMKCDTSRNIPQFKLDHLKTILVTCAVGILVAAVVLLVEMWKIRKRKQ